MIKYKTDFWNSIDNKTKFTVFVSILTFSLGFIINEFIKQVFEKKRKKSFKKSLFFLLNEFAESCKKQNQIISKSLNKASFTNNSDFIIKTTPIHSITYLASLDLQDLVINLDKRWKHQPHNKALSKLIIVISQINDNGSETKNLISEMRQRYAVHESGFQNHLGRLRDLYDELTEKTINRRMPPNIQPFAEAYGRIFIDWRNDGQDISFKNTHENIVRKVLDVCRQHINEVSLNALKDALSADLSYINIQKIEATLYEGFKNSAFIHYRCYRLTKVIIKILEPSSILSILKKGLYKNKRHL